MCLIVLGWRADPRYPLLVAANRDEFHARPAAPAA
ncbi:MAG: NRDE family protein, partial [Betaproteobacteria bacterium]